MFKELTAKSAFLILAAFLVLLACVFPFVKPDTTLEEYEETGLFQSNTGTTWRVYERKGTG